jgi:DNA recombination protein RmuC
VLDGVQKKLGEASRKIEDTSRRSRAMGRALRDVEALPSGDAHALLGLAVDAGDEPD